jgi:hypothetical protein
VFVYLLTNPPDGPEGQLPIGPLLSDRDAEGAEPRRDQRAAPPELAGDIAETSTPVVMLPSKPLDVVEQWRRGRPSTMLRVDESVARDPRPHDVGTPPDLRGDLSRRQP